MLGWRRRASERKNDQDRWLITYADMITLLLIFFIVLYTMSKFDADKFKALTVSLAEHMGAGKAVLDTSGPSLVPESNISEVEELTEEELEDIRRGLLSFAAERGLAGKISVTTEQRGVVVSFQDDVLFPSGSARLTAEARALINEVAPVLGETDNPVRVEGHTDNLPIHNEQFPSNWELSAARATSVLQELLRTGNFQPWRLSAVAYGEYRSRVPNDTPQNRQLNRRVDIVILREKYEGSEPGTANTTTGATSTANTSP